MHHDYLNNVDFTLPNIKLAAYVETKLVDVSSTTSDIVSAEIVETSTEGNVDLDTELASKNKDDDVQDNDVSVAAPPSKRSDGNKMFPEVHGDLSDDDDYGMECKENSSDYDTSNMVQQSNGLTKKMNFKADSKMSLPLMMEGILLNMTARTLQNEALHSLKKYDNFKTD